VREQRKKIWIDRFQTSLFLRIALYFVIYQMAVWALFIIERTILVSISETLGAGAATYCSLFLVATVILLGVLFIYDAVKLAHRIVGPIYRFRQTVKAITAGEEVRLVVLRQGDFLGELRDDFNEMLKLLEQRGAIVLKTGGAKQDQKQSLPV
jgi:nitrogen fixation/metabolism regulation signal transduction histidine kinase